MSSARFEPAMPVIHEGEQDNWFHANHHTAQRHTGSRINSWRSRTHRWQFEQETVAVLSWQSITHNTTSFPLQTHSSLTTDLLTDWLTWWERGGTVSGVGVSTAKVAPRPLHNCPVHCTLQNADQWRHDSCYWNTVQVTVRVQSAEFGTRIGCRSSSNATPTPSSKRGLRACWRRAGCNRIFETSYG